MVELTLFFICSNLLTANVLLGIYTWSYWTKLKKSKQEAEQFVITSPEDVIKHYEENYYA